MNVLEKAEKALEFLKNCEGSTKSHELQSAAGTLGRCLGALGSRPNYTRHYANLLHTAIPTLLGLASNNSAEVRLVGDEALNRVVVGGFPFHAHKCNIILQNQIDHTRNARWIRAALQRICLGETWLRPGVGKIRAQAQTLFPKLSVIVRQGDDQLIVEALEANLPRILKALAEFSTDEELIELSKALQTHADSPEPAIRRCVASCIARICGYRPVLITALLDNAFDKLWPHTNENTVVIGWFNIIKSVFQLNKMKTFTENDLFTVVDYLELYQLTINYIDQSSDHNIQNCLMECLTVLLSQADGRFRKALLEKKPKRIDLDTREKVKGHSRNISSTSAITSIMSASLSRTHLDDTSGELSFSGNLHLASLSAMTSVEDLTVHTPETPTSDHLELDLQNAEEILSQDLTEKLERVEAERSGANLEVTQVDCGVKVNIGSSTDEDVLLKYCARLLTTKFLLTGNKGGVISDRSVRVSVKSSALCCLSEILKLYPQAATIFVDKEAEIKSHNISGSSESTGSNQDQINDFILERNICYQDSLTDSLTQDLNKSSDSQATFQSQQISKKSLEKSIDSLKSGKDIPSAILDSKKDLIASAISADTNMTTSNFTSNSNMTGSNTGYPMSSSGDLLSSSIDLDMKFDHFAENFECKRLLKRTDEVHIKDMPDFVEKVDVCVGTEEKVFEFQHLSEIFGLLEGHGDPQVRGLIRVCIGNYLSAAIDLSHGDYGRWKNYVALSKDVSDNVNSGKLVEIVLKGLSDEIHSCVNHTLQAITNISASLAMSTDFALLSDILKEVLLENNKYYLCKVNLCAVYKVFNYERLFMLDTDFYNKTRLILDKLFLMLSDQDQKVRNAAADTIASITPKITPPKKSNATSMLLKTASKQSQQFKFETPNQALELVKDMYFYFDLPDRLKKGCYDVVDEDSLRMCVSEIMESIMQSNCKFYSQGLLQALKETTKRYPPTQYRSAYSNQGILEYCVEKLDCCDLPVQARTALTGLCCDMYPVEIHNIMSEKSSNRDIFERDAPTKKYGYLSTDIATLSAKFESIILRCLNVIVHLIEEISPTGQVNKVLPGSPVRKTEDSRKNQSETEEKSRKKTPITITNMRANFAGNFYSEPFYMKLYDNLRATYSNHKINLDPKSSIFYDHLTSILDALSIQLELSTEKEYGPITEEILYYLKVIMPCRPDKTVHCVTQLLKCLFCTNMINQYPDYMAIETENIKENSNFFNDVLLLNKLEPIDEEEVNKKMLKERDALINIENFSKNKTDRKWSTNKKELERYIRLFEPVVIQALKSYTMQNDVPLQSSVLLLLSQLLSLRVNYCMLDSDQVFIAFLLRQLELVEQGELPNCEELVSNIMLFLVQLSSSKHHSKQIIEIPKLIQLCDGLLASGATKECVLALSPLAIKVFTSTSLGLAPQREAAATREVVCYMLHKCLSVHQVLNLTSCVLALSQENPENYVRWSEQSADSIFSMLAQRAVDLDERNAVIAMERHIDLIHRSVLLEQKRVEMVLKIIFQAPPEQSTATLSEKMRYLTTTMILLRKIFVLVPESEILLSINYLKATHVSPQALFFNVKTEIDPLNVRNVNENCANLSPDVILVRFLFRLLTYVILEVDNCNEVECSNMDVENGGEHRFLYSVCVNLICQVKNMLHLTDNCLFPLTSKTAQSILHNEQSGLNTGLYSPDENIPLELLNLVCLRSSHRVPLLTVHWSHLLIRLRFLEQKYWQNLLGFVRSLPLCGGNSGLTAITADTLQVGCFLAYCEYFVENGLSEAVHLTWLLVNRIHILISQSKESIVQELVDKVHGNASASGLLLQAVAARCSSCLKGEFALNTYKILKGCHVSQSGALIFFICRVIGKLEPSVAARFASLAIERCELLKQIPATDVNAQLSKEDVQVALELLQRDKVHIRFKKLVSSLNILASANFDLSPLDGGPARAVNPHSVLCQETPDMQWLLKQVANRCSQSATSTPPRIEKNHELALLIANLSKEDITTVINNQDFDRNILGACFKVSSEMFLKELLNIVSVWENKEIEKQNFREQQRKAQKEEFTLDNNKITNPMHVFKKNDNKESKSQFFIPIESDKVPKLQISDEQNEIIPPELPDLYVTAVMTFDKSLTEVARQFPKQSRPLSASENFNLSIETTIDRYTKRCHQVFQDKLFYQEYIILQNILTGYLESLQNMLSVLEDIDIDVYDRCNENILPKNLAKNIALFSVISLQYLSFLIKNKKIVESPVNTDVSFRVTSVVTEKVVIDRVVRLTLENVSKALSVKAIWCQLNSDSNVNRKQSAISCFYAIVKYLVKDTKPLVLKHYIETEEPKSDIIIICEKLLTLIEYWEDNFYATDITVKYVLGVGTRKHVEDALVALAKLDIVSPASLVPPAAWSGLQVAPASGDLQQLGRVELPLAALQDLDVLQPFLFRVNLIGWSSKKQFEEIWVALLGALQGNGGHVGVRGMMQLLLGAAGGAPHDPRGRSRVHGGMQLLRNILIGTSMLNKEFKDVNLERIPLARDGVVYHCGQYSTDYMKLAADVTDEAPYQVKLLLKRVRRNTEIDLNSCIQLLLDVATQMLDPKAPTGLAARAALLQCVSAAAPLLPSAASWERLARLAARPPPHLPALTACLALAPPPPQEMASIQQKLLASLSSQQPAARHAALHGVLLLGGGLPPDPALLPARRHSDRISLYEQALCWALLFSLLERGQPELVAEAVDFLLARPTHYLADLVVKGITSAIRQQVLPKELKNAVISRLLERMPHYQESHAVQIMMVHLFSADNKLLSPKTSTSIMDPDVLMNSMERLTLLYKVYRQCNEKENKLIVKRAIEHIVRESAPPAAALSRVVIEFLQNCEGDGRGAVGAAEVVLEVFETAVAQNQLPVLSGWIFEAVCHLVQDKITPRLLPYCLTLLLVAASPNIYIRRIGPLCLINLRLGFERKNIETVNGYFSIFLEDDHVISFVDKRLLCVVAMHSGFSKSQLGRLKELCEENECLDDLYKCLTVE